ncbi:MAG: hypothetical protein QN170_06340 [Armatimonadota bacterium]|nr:hypothetical protein [Armatimonadota bacterium]
MTTKFVALLVLGLLLAAPSWAHDLDTVLIVSIDALHPDAHEGICAFLDKRVPTWRGWSEG